MIYRYGDLMEINISTEPREEKWEKKYMSLNPKFAQSILARTCWYAGLIVPRPFYF